MSDAHVDVDSWFASHTFRGADFRAEDLVAAKAGRSIAVLIPAKDEAATVGAIVAEIRRALVTAVPLVDEVVVIDSHSADDTAEVAHRAGAAVHHDDEVLPELGSRPGKGEAMWKALAVTDAEFGVYLDADVTDFSADFVTGLLGPLLSNEGLVFTKAFYDRPWGGGGAASTGGGRVTELAARPAIAERVPELSGFVQPLAGECAFRVEALRAVPFVSGYGVDIGLMIDVLRAHGLDAMAQVDLGVRRHHHQDLAALSAMAQQVIGAVELRTGAAHASDAVGRPHVAFARGADGAMHRRASTVTVTQRPPMRDVLDRALR